MVNDLRPHRTKTRNRDFFIAFTLLVSFLCFNFYVRDLGLNKTVGWAYDVRSVAYVGTFVNALLAMLGYLLFSLFKARINRRVAFLHVAYLVVLVVFDFFQWYQTILYMNLVPMILLLVNIVVAVVNWVARMSAKRLARHNEG